MSQKKETIFNLIALVFLPLCMGIVNIVKMRLFIDVLGNDQNGLYQFYMQLFSYFVIVETGMELAVCSTLFKYLVHRQHDEINRMIKGVRIYWRRMAGLNVIAGLFLLPLTLYIVKDMPNMELFVVIHLCYILKSTFNYLMAGPHTIAIADNKGYIVMLFDSSAILISSLLSMIAVFMGQQLVSVVIIEVIVTLIFVITKFYYIKHRFKWLKIPYNNTASFEFKDLLKGTLTTRVTEMIVNNTDLLIITIFLGVNVTSWFSIYNNFGVILILMLSTSLVNSLQALMGKNFVSNDALKVQQIQIKRMKRANYFVVLSTVPIIMLGLAPFIHLFYAFNQIVDFNFYFVYISFIYFKMIKTPYSTLKISFGKYNQFIPYSIANAVLKISFSVLLMQFWGVTGVVMGSIVSYVIAELWYELKVFDRQILSKRWHELILEVVMYYVITLSLGGCMYYFFHPFFTNFVNLIIICFLAFILLTLSVGGVFYWLFADFRSFAKLLGKKKNYSAQS